MCRLLKCISACMRRLRALSAALRRSSEKKNYVFYVNFNVTWTHVKHMLNRLFRCGLNNTYTKGKNIKEKPWIFSIVAGQILFKIIFIFIFKIFLINLAFHKSIFSNSIISLTMNGTFPFAFNRLIDLRLCSFEFHFHTLDDNVSSLFVRAGHMRPRCIVHSHS